MRNRPDSRGRLTGLTTAGLTPAGPSPAAPLPLWPGGGEPAEDDEWLPVPPVGRRTDDGGQPGGWVPDVDGPPSPFDRAAERADTAESVDRAQSLADRAAPPETPAGARALRVRHSPAHAWGRVAQRWVPEPLRDARVDPGRRGALLLTVVAAVAALVAAVGVWRDHPQARPVQAVSLAQVSDGALTAGTATTGRTTGPLRSATPLRSASANSSGSAAVGTVGAGATTAAEVLVVSVTGAVRHPGLVRLAPGSRVADAIAEAGGVTGAADLTGVNLAARLTDGASVVVSDQAIGGGSSVSGLGPDKAGGSSTTARSGPAGKVDLNTADAATLDALPGVGPVTAAAIVAWRDKNGRYTSVEQLQEIQGIGPAKYAALAPMVTV